MRVCLEATSLLGHRSGVGHTAAALASGLMAADPDVEVVLFPMVAGDTASLTELAATHPRMHARPGRLSTRLAAWLWWRTEFPAAERFFGEADVFHGPNYLLPPLRRTPGVVTVFDLAFVKHPELCTPAIRTFARTVPRTARRARLVTVGTDAVAADLAAWLPEVAGRIRKVPAPVRDAFREPGREPGREASDERRAELGIREPYVVFVGNLEARKDVGTLLAAFARLRNEHPDAHLVCVGRPSVGWEEIVAHHAEVLASGAVSVLGSVSDPEVAALLRGAVALAYPSRYEGFGIPPLEAMACGTPAVVSDIPPHREILGPHARFHPVGDAEALAGILSELLDAPPSAQVLEAAAAHARAFTPERTARAALDVYREALER